MSLLIRQTFSQRTWPKVGDLDDCWLVSAIQCAHAVAPWLPLLDATEFRAHAGRPDRPGHVDGGNVDVILAGMRSAWPALAALSTPLRGSWSWDRVLAAIKSGRPATVCVMSSKLAHGYGHTGAHQVTYFHEPGVGLRVANPLAPDRSTPTRIATAAARDAAFAYGNGKVFAILFPTVAAAFTTHPLYVPPAPPVPDAATLARLDRVKRLVADAATAVEAA